MTLHRTGFGGLGRLLSVLGAAWLATATAVGKPPARYLFLDPTLLERTEGAVIRVNPAARRETVILPDRPWEQLMISFFLTVRDEGEKLRLWYVCRDQWENGEANVAYAESTDGVHWTKPNLRIYDYRGSRENNLVGLHSLEGVVFADPTVPAEERYQYVSTSRLSGNADTSMGLFRFFSPDGLHWRRDGQPLIEAGSDTQNGVWWDDNLQRYVLILRSWNTHPNRRKVSRLTLPSLKQPASVKPDGSGVGHYFHNEIPTVLICDERDPSRTDIYNMSALPYPVDPAWYVGFPTFFRRSEKTDAPGWRGRHMGRTEVQFAGSRDSAIWHRYDRAPYAEPGVTEPAKKNMVFMGTGLVARGDELWQYGVEFESVHGDVEARKRKTDGAIVRYVQRIDGFVSLDSGERPGTARTRPLKITGRSLRLNVNTGGLGELRVGLVDEAGRPLAGFDVADCEPIETNDTGVKVAWHNGSDLAGLLGREVSLVFTSTRAKLYSFRFE